MLEKLSRTILLWEVLSLAMVCSCQSHMEFPRPEIGTWARSWYKTVQRLIDDGKLKPSPVRLLPGRFEGIIEGLKMLKEGTISGQKLVVLLENAA